MLIALRQTLTYQTENISELNHATSCPLGCTGSQHLEGFFSAHKVSQSRSSPQIGSWSNGEKLRMLARLKLALVLQ